MIIAAKRYLWLVSGWAPSTNHSLRLFTQTIPDITAPKVCTYPPYSFWSEQFWLHSRFNQYGTGTEPSIFKKHIVVFLLKSIAKIECNPCIWLLLISFTVFRSKERKNFFINNDKEIIWLWGSSSNFSSRSPRHNTYVQQGQQSLNLYTERKKSPGRHQKNYQELSS